MGINIKVYKKTFKISSGTWQRLVDACFLLDEAVVRNLRTYVLVIDFSRVRPARFHNKFPGLDLVLRYFGAWSELAL